MTFEEIRVVAQEYHTRGDAVGMYRFLRDCVSTAGGPRQEGIARAILADTLVKWRLGSPSAIEAELARARALLRPYPEDYAHALFVHMYWRATENDSDTFEALRAVYDRLCARYPHLAGVQRWRGRITVWRGYLALAHGRLAEATEYYRRSLLEYEQHETDPESREQLIRMSKLNLARFALRSGDFRSARQYLDECEGSTISRLWETIRACTEVEFALQTLNWERAQFWLRIARSWATPQTEAAAILTLTQARVSYALGEREKARLLTLEARRLAAQYKQDDMLPEIRAFFRLQESGAGAGILAQGGTPLEDSLRRVAAAGSGADARHRSRG